MTRQSSTDVSMRTDVREDLWIPTVCHVCNRGPDAIMVRRVNGVVVAVEGNPAWGSLAPNNGKCCVKARCVIQKLYTPHRIKRPLKRTNPKKGINEDPGFVEIDWDEALDLVADKLRSVLTGDPKRLNFADGDAQSHTLGSVPVRAFREAFGSGKAFGSGGGIWCTQGEHMFGNMWHAAYTCEPDLSHCNYLLLFGRNPMASGGAPENVQYAEARARGMRMIVFDAMLSTSAAKADEWIPIHPGTDNAVLLSLINVTLNEIQAWDEGFLKEMTTSPYLVGEDGYFVRDASGKPLVWNAASSAAEPHDMADPRLLSLTGSYLVDGRRAIPSFEALRLHVKTYTPEWAETLADVPASTIRRLAREWIEYAQMGTSTRVGDLELPLRPVAIKIGRGVTGVLHSYTSVLCSHILSMIVGGLEVAGGHIGGHAATGGFHRGIVPGADGSLAYESFPIDWPPSSITGQESLLPYTKLLAYPVPGQLAYRKLAQAPATDDYPVDVFIKYRINPLVSVGQTDVIVDAFKRIPFVVAISYVIDETTWFADVVLPDHTDLEKYELAQMYQSMGKKFTGWLLRQPVVEPLWNTMDIGELCGELASRLGILPDYNAALNKLYALGEAYALNGDRKYAWTEVVDHCCQSATNGAHGIEWFKKNGGVASKTPVSEQYDVHLTMRSKRLRYPLPYQEHVKRKGDDLKRILEANGVTWWSASDYTALPTWIPSPLVTEMDEASLYCITYKSQLFAWANNVDLPWLLEVAEHEHGLSKVLIHPAAAAKRGIKDGDRVKVESESGYTEGEARVTEGIRPDTVAIGSMFGHWQTPESRDKHWASQEPLVGINTRHTDHLVGNMQGLAAAVKVSKVRKRG